MPWDDLHAEVVAEFAALPVGLDSRDGAPDELLGDAADLWLHAEAKRQEAAQRRRDAQKLNPERERQKKRERYVLRRDMDTQERERLRKRDREYQRKRRARETPEQRERRLAKNREYQTRLREQRKLQKALDLPPKPE